MSTTPTAKSSKAAFQALVTEASDLEAKIEAKQAELAAIALDTKAANVRKGQVERRLKESQAKYDQLEEAYRKREQDLKLQLEKTAKEYLTFQADYESEKLALVAAFDALQTGIKTSKRELKERQQYLKEQEALIHNTLADGEARLADLDYQVKQVLQQQQESLQTAEQLAGTNEKLGLEISEAADKKEKLDAIYSEAASRYKVNLQDMYLQIETAVAAHKKQLSDGKTMVARLTAKEKELEQREFVLIEQEKKIAQERRFIESRKGLYTAP